MKINEITKVRENASAGACSAGAIAGVVTPLGSAPGFGSDDSASIYKQIKKNRKARKKNIKESQCPYCHKTATSTHDGDIEIDGHLVYDHCIRCLAHLPTDGGEYSENGDGPFCDICYQKVLTGRERGE